MLFSNCFLSLKASSALFTILYATLILESAQVAYGGQTFTQGLAIIDAPSPGSPGHAGSNLVIAIDISGDGHLSSDSANPNSTASAHFDLLEIYLVSSQTNMNFTVTNGTSFLTNETGTVRHLNWPIPKCIPAGQYNLTYYELSHINGTVYYTITPVSSPIDNPNPSGDKCTEGVNDLQQQPQASSPPPVAPFFENGSTLPPAAPSSASPVVLVSFGWVCALLGLTSYMQLY